MVTFERCKSVLVIVPGRNDRAFYAFYKALIHKIFHNNKIKIYDNRFKDYVLGRIFKIYELDRERSVLKGIVVVTIINNENNNCSHIIIYHNNISFGG